MGDQGWISRQEGYTPTQVALVIKNLPMQETQEMWVRSLGWEIPWSGEMATCSSTLAWKIPWTEEPGELQSMGSQESEMTKHTGNWLQILLGQAVEISMVVLSFWFILSLDSLPVTKSLPEAMGPGCWSEIFLSPQAKRKALISGVIGAIWLTCRLLASDHENPQGMLWPDYID